MVARPYSILGSPYSVRFPPIRPREAWDFKREATRPPQRREGQLRLEYWAYHLEDDGRHNPTTGAARHRSGGSAAPVDPLKVGVVGGVGVIVDSADALHSWPALCPAGEVAYTLRPPFAAR
jgi:hypothetical protein